MFSGISKLISQLTEKETPEDADNIIIGSGSANRVTWPNLVSALVNRAIESLNTTNKTISGAINELLGNSVKTAVGTATTQQVYANTTYSISIPITVPDGSTIIGASVYSDGGVPLMYSVNGITNSVVQVYFRSAIDASARTMRAIVFYR